MTLTFLDSYGYHVQGKSSVHIESGCHAVSYFRKLVTTSLSFVFCGQTFGNK